MHGKDDGRFRLSSHSAFSGWYGDHSDTIRRTSGSTTSRVGNATIHDKAQAAGQVANKAGVGPRLLSVEMADTTNVIGTDRIRGITTDA